VDSKKLEKYSGILRVDAAASLKLHDRYVPQVKILLSEIREEGIDTPLRFGELTGKTIEITEPLNRISDYLF